MNEVISFRTQLLFNRVFYCLHISLSRSYTFSTLGDKGKEKFPLTSSLALGGAINFYPLITEGTSKIYVYTVGAHKVTRPEVCARLGTTPERFLLLLFLEDKKVSSAGLSQVSR